MKFARAANDNAGIREALEKVVLFKADRNEDANSDLMESLGAKGIPHFFVLDAEDEVIGRWRGFGEPEEWLMAFDQAVSEPSSLEAKAAAYATAPTESVAAVLARARSAADDRKGAVILYRDAQRIAGKPVGEYAWGIFYNTYRGLDKDEFTVDEVKAAADASMATPSSDMTPLDVGLLMSRVAEDKEDPSLLQPWLRRAIEHGQSLTDPEYDEAKTELAIVEALRVNKDGEAAYGLKLKTLESGWETDADELNGLAWWLYENRIKLPEAREHARKGIELAKDGKQRAMILDTAAEIENALGNPAESLKLIAEAMELDPTNEQYRTQLSRFQDLAKPKG